MGDPKATSLRSLPPGCRFYPSEEQLLCCYLSNKNDADPAQSGGYDLIRELDLYDHDPFDLPDSACYSYGHAGRKRHWFCYTVRVLKERRAKSGYWRRKGRDRDVVGRGGKAVLGRRTSFVFYLGNSPNTAVRTDWVLYQYAQVDHVMASFVLCRVFVRSRGNRLSYNGVSSCAEESACTVRHIGIQHDGFHTPNIVETEVHGDNSAHRKNEMLNFPMRLDCEINDRVKNGPVSISRLQPNVCRQKYPHDSKQMKTASTYGPVVCAWW
ncbi:NAC domain-containing protein 72-like isoform X2 [Prunus avium]|uniref:NAC domain-containing protein 72-like isoform X2 n=1 Tax=Prunus avium TaxID=42229 RepID=A0A6P5T0Q5_PRUAV|nr:NAC domain-containing protein 72-like isoform X2 [Prunus avium]